VVSARRSGATGKEGNIAITRGQEKKGDSKGEVYKK
jgi:hypothetical protein